MSAELPYICEECGEPILVDDGDVSVECANCGASFHDECLDPHQEREQ